MKISCDRRGRLSRRSSGVTGVQELQNETSVFPRDSDFEIQEHTNNHPHSVTPELLQLLPPYALS
jgi:hypothetical protein